jgi:hypothetical protein
MTDKLDQILFGMGLYHKQNSRTYRIFIIFFFLFLKQVNKLKHLKTYKLKRLQTGRLADLQLTDLEIAKEINL